MKACILTEPEAGGAGRVTVADIATPEKVGPRDVRIAVRAAALNHLDLFVIDGLPGARHAFPHVLGADAAGVVDVVGEAVTRVNPGERVMINPGISDGSCEFCRRGEESLCVNYRLLGEHLPGTLAQYVVVPETNVAVIPRVEPSLTWGEAAAFSLVTLTAWRMVVTRARVQPGEWVLVWGVGGGVSLAAMRVAKLRGGRVIATSSDDAKLHEARALGADITVNHGSERVAETVRRVTEKRGVDVVIENVGQATWEESLRCLAKAGRLVTCGATSGPHVVSDVRRIFWNQYTIMGSTMGNAAEYHAVVQVLGSGQLRPVVDRVFPLAEAREAFGRLRRGEQLGKIVVEVSPD